MASLIARRRTTQLTISADLSIHLLEVCPLALRGRSLRIDDALSPASARAQAVSSAFFDLQHRRFSVLPRPKTRIQNT